MKATVYFCFASSPVTLGPFKLAPQSVWAANSLLTRVGNTDYQWCLVEGDGVSRLVKTSEVIEASSKSTAVEYPLDAIWQNGITQNEDDLQQLVAEHEAGVAEQQRKRDEAVKRAAEEAAEVAQKAANPDAQMSDLNMWATGMKVKVKSITTGDRSKLNVIAFNLHTFPDVALAVTDAAYADRNSPFYEFMGMWDEAQADSLEDPFEWKGAPTPDIINFIGGRVSEQASRGFDIEGQLTQWVRIIGLLDNLPYKEWYKYLPMTQAVKPEAHVTDSLTTFLNGIDKHSAPLLLFPQRFASQCARKVEDVFAHVFMMTGANFAAAAKYMEDYRVAVMAHLANCQHSNDRHINGRAPFWSPLYWADELYNRFVTSASLNPLVTALTNDPAQQERALEDYCMAIIARGKTATERSKIADEIRNFIVEMRPLGAPLDYTWENAIGNLDRPNPAWASIRRWLINRVWETGGIEDNAVAASQSELEQRIKTAVEGVRSAEGTFSAISTNVSIFRKFAQDKLKNQGPVAAAPWVAYVEAGCPDFNPLNTAFITDSDVRDIVGMLRNALAKVAFNAAYSLLAIQESTNSVSDSALLAVAYTAAQNECSSFRRVAGSMCPLDQRPFQWMETYANGAARAYKYMTDTDTDPLVDSVVNEVLRKVRGGVVTDQYMMNFVQQTIEAAVADTTNNRGGEYDEAKFSYQRQILIDTLARVHDKFRQEVEFVYGTDWAVNNASYLTMLFTKLSPIPFNAWDETLIRKFIANAARAVYPTYRNNPNAYVESIKTATRLVTNLIQVMIKPLITDQDVSKWIVRNTEKCPKNLRDTFITFTSMAVDDDVVKSVFGTLSELPKDKQCQQLLNEFESSLLSLRGTSENNLDCSWEYMAAQRDALINVRRKLFRVGGEEVHRFWRNWVSARSELMLSVHANIDGADAVLGIAANAVRRESRQSAEALAAKVLGLMAEIAVLLGNIETDDGAGEISWVEWRAAPALRITFRTTLRPIMSDVNAQDSVARALVSSVVRKAFGSDIHEAEVNPGLVALYDRLASVPKAPYGGRLKGQLEILYTERTQLANYANNVRQYGEDRSVTKEQQDYFESLSAAIDMMAVLRATELKETHNVGALTDMLVLAVREGLEARSTYSIAKLATEFHDEYDTLFRLFMVVRPMSMRASAWMESAVDRNIAPSLRQGMRDITMLLDSTDDLLELMKKHFSDVCDFGTDTKSEPETATDAGMPGRIVHAPLRKGTGGGLGYVAVAPTNPASGVDLESLFSLSNSNPQTQRVLSSLGSKYGMYELEEEVIADLARNSKHLGVRKKLPLANIVVVGCSDATCILSANVGGQLVGIIMLNPKELAGIFGSFSTQSALHAITHELGHYVHRSLKGTKKLDWDKSIAGRRNLHPKQGKDGYAFDTEQFAILAEAMVWGDSCRGLFTCNGYNVVSEFFVDNYLTDEDRQRIV